MLDLVTAIFDQSMIDSRDDPHLFRELFLKRISEADGLLGIWSSVLPKQNPKPSPPPPPRLYIIPIIGGDMYDPMYYDSLSAARTGIWHLFQTYGSGFQGELRIEDDEFVGEFETRIEARDILREAESYLHDLGKP